MKDEGVVTSEVGAVTNEDVEECVVIEGVGGEARLVDERKRIECG